MTETEELARDNWELYGEDSAVQCFECITLEAANPRPKYNAPVPLPDPQVTNEESIYDDLPFLDDLDGSMLFYGDE